MTGIAIGIASFVICSFVLKLVANHLSKKECEEKRKNEEARPAGGQKAARTQTESELLTAPY
jgi:hypothetical protein